MCDVRLFKNVVKFILGFGVLVIITNCNVFVELNVVQSNLSQLNVGSKEKSETTLELSRRLVTMNKILLQFKLLNYCE